MISRVAESAFWFGRYLERTEAMARVLEVTAGASLDAGAREADGWMPLVIVSGEAERFAARNPGAAGAEVVQRFLTWEPAPAASLVASAFAARDNARSIREVVSLEAWQATNELYLWLQSDAARALYDEHRHAFTTHVRRAVQLALGLLRSTMLHDDGLDLIWMGVLLERAGQTARALDLFHHTGRGEPDRHPEVVTALWLSVLRACSGFEPFMKRHRGQVSGTAVAAFLMLEPRFPRSIRYCVDQAYDRFCALRAPHQPSLPGARTNARFEALRKGVRQITPALLEKSDVHEVLTRIVDDAAGIGQALAEELFGHAPAV